ncbi:metal-dependent transcriptional regulator [Levilactobacillus parabrevis]|uniref:Mn-dependent transcriptional regulator n=1 Tax=Levilactobacillus parabrevis ATCC 53295 TaxID=1267003 RepID=A0A0R1H6V9_9LACO|nr:metal-dependent transcriptional regulator [Levilactobacillus parabrevis]KRK39585.1 Mn-dependent transcriptional regulator [Levilactobacillus parabrevis ATCC 53295]KRO06931.1 Mn-dependent transcriptional regulator [Levilactobacillus parabrevis]
MLNHRNTYIKIIAECNFARPRVSNKQIIHFANVSPATVTEMTRSLEHAGLVNRRRYTGVTLTPTGEQLACQLLRHYRLCETFLVQKLHLPLIAVPGQAWGMAADLTAETALALNHYLGAPQHSPFGGSLNPTQILDDSPITRLSAVSVPTTVVLTSYLESAALVDYLQHLGLPFGVPLQVTKVDASLNLLYLEDAQQREYTLNDQAADYIYTKKA